MICTFFILIEWKEEEYRLIRFDPILSLNNARGYQMHNYLMATNEDKVDAILDKMQQENGEEALT